MLGSHQLICCTSILMPASPEKATAPVPAGRFGLACPCALEVRMDHLSDIKIELTIY